MFIYLNFCISRLCSVVLSVKLQEINQKLTRDKEEQAAKENDRNNEIRKLQVKVNDLEKEFKKVKDQITCKICLVKDIDIVLLPCCHFCCTSCSTQLEKCGICRTIIKQREKVYMA